MGVDLQGVVRELHFEELARLKSNVLCNNEYKSAGIQHRQSRISSACIGAHSCTSLSLFSLDEFVFPQAAHGAQACQDFWLRMFTGQEAIDSKWSPYVEGKQKYVVCY